MRILDQAEWQVRRATHERRVDAWIGTHLARRGRGGKHPVEDFLFTYYPNRAARLRRWHPGLGVALAGPDATEYLAYDGYARAAGGTVAVDPTLLPEPRRAAARRTAELLRRSADRPAHLGCFGLHEWAMVYRSPASDVRHPAWPLRFPPAGIAAVVDSMRLTCTHVDAYRFFTPAARPLNTFEPTRASQPDLDQPGCLHANMDLYKWAYLLTPYIGSDLVADCFALAREIRTLDMRASPYDLAALGYPPVRVETAAGRAEYVAGQRRFAAAAASLRARLTEVYDAVLAAAPA
ncbi:MAG TPA: 3-methyladenine DNA glycosylase [Mycobacteriales bacterium]|nr:3-methyladenine DNA glycosylase [Mycobacteriales bacterium]